MRWIQQNPAATASIPGGRRVAQAEEKVAAADLPELSPALMAQLDAVYARDSKPWVHARW